MEYLRPIMIELNRCSLRPNNHLNTFTMNLPERYQEHLCEKCAPHTIPHKAKYALHAPHISMGKCSDLSITNSEINEITQEPFEDEEFQEPSVNAEKYSRLNPPPSTSFVKPRSICCRLSQVKCHCA